MPPNAVGASPLRAGLDQVQEAQRPLPEPWRASEHAKRGEQTKVANRMATNDGTVESVELAIE